MGKLVPNEAAKAERKAAPVHGCSRCATAPVLCNEKEQRPLLLPSTGKGYSGGAVPRRGLREEGTEKTPNQTTSTDSDARCGSLFVLIFRGFSLPSSYPANSSRKTRFCIP